MCSDINGLAGIVRPPWMSNRGAAVDRLRPFFYLLYSILSPFPSRFRRWLCFCGVPSRAVGEVDGRSVVHLRTAHAVHVGKVIRRRDSADLETRTASGGMRKSPAGRRLKTHIAANRNVTSSPVCILAFYALEIADYWPRLSPMISPVVTLQPVAASPCSRHL